MAVLQFRLRKGRSFTESARRLSSSFSALVVGAARCHGLSSGWALTANPPRPGSSALSVSLCGHMPVHEGSRPVSNCQALPGRLGGGTEGWIPEGWRVYSARIIDTGSRDNRWRLKVGTRWCSCPSFSSSSWLSGPHSGPENGSPGTKSLLSRGPMPKPFMGKPIRGSAGWCGGSFRAAGRSSMASSGCSSPCLALSTYQRSQASSAYADAFLNSWETYSSRTAAGRNN